MSTSGRGVYFTFIYYLFIYLSIYLFLVFRDRVPLYSPGYPGTHSVDHAGLELRNLPASTSQVLGLKACTTTAQLKNLFLILANTTLTSLVSSHLFST